MRLFGKFGDKVEVCAYIFPPSSRLVRSNARPLMETGKLLTLMEPMNVARPVVVLISYSFDARPILPEVPYKVEWTAAMVKQKRMNLNIVEPKFWKSC